MVEKAAEVESRGHRETLGADSGQGCIITCPSVTGSLACSPKWTDVPGAETGYRLLNNLFFYSRLCSQHLPDFTEKEPGNNQPSSFLHTHVDPFQNCLGAESVHESGCFIHITATAHPALRTVPVYEEALTGLCVSSTEVSAIHLRRLTLEEVIHHSLG